MERIRNIFWIKSIKFNLIFVLILIFSLIFLSGCSLLEGLRYNVVTVIGIDNTGSFIRRTDEEKRQVISKIVYDIVKEKANYQKNDNMAFFRKYLGGIEVSDMVIICPISYRGIGGVKRFLICKDDPISLSKSLNFKNPENVKNLIFPKDEVPYSRTDFIQFFKELRSIYGDIERLRVNYILFTDGVPDPEGNERLSSEEMSTEYLIKTYGKEYIKGLDELLPEYVKIMFIGVDSNVYEFWKYVLNSMKKERKMNIYLVSSYVQPLDKEKIKEISNPYSW